MGFEAIRGQDVAVGILRRALASGRLHHAYRFEGPDGVGKEMAALALAQTLLCERPRTENGLASACGQCGACKRASTFADAAPRVCSHPDLCLIERGLYPPELINKASEKTAISVEQIRRIVLERAGYPPHEGRARVFIVRRAEEMGQAAANARAREDGCVSCRVAAA